MSTTAATGAEYVTWDLSDLYGGADDPRLEGDRDEATRSAAAFSERYRGQVATLEADALVEAVRELERIEAIRIRVGAFAYLLFSEDTGDAAGGALLQRTQEWDAALETELLFFRLEWTAVSDEDADRVLESPELEGYRHLLHSLRRYRPHLLTEPEERILTEKSVSGRAAWARLYEELCSSVRVILGGSETSLDDALSKLQSPDPEVRRETAGAVNDALASGLRTRAFTLNAIVLDKAIDDRLRSYPHWLTERNLSNEIDDEVVDTLVSSIVGRYDIAQRYYALKAKLLGVPRLAHWDRYAPVVATEGPVEWDEARELVLEAYTAFSPDVGSLVGQFFERPWIHAPLSPGKHGGAYCMTRIPGAHPYILLNYTGERRSVLTLAHELGHGLHGQLARDAGVFNSETPLTLAETASVFGESLVFRLLFEREDDPRRRLDLLIGRIDDAVATVFRQIALNRFEDTLHAARRGEGELSGDRLAELWLDTQRAMLGDAVETEGYESWWSYISHFTSAPGYVYAYAFGYLFSLAIFRRYEREGDAVVEPYLDLLRAGGSDSPERLAALVGLDVRRAELWQDGLGALDELVSEAEELAATVS